MRSSPIAMRHSICSLRTLKFVAHGHKISALSVLLLLLGADLLLVEFGGEGQPGMIQFFVIFSIAAKIGSGAVPVVLFCLQPWPFD